MTQFDESSGAQYTATAHYSDGSTPDVIVCPVCSVTPAYYALISGGTLTTASFSSDQEVTIMATFDAKSNTHTVTISDTATGCVPSTVL